MPDCGFLEKKDTVPLTFVSAQWIFAIWKCSPVNDSLGKGGCWEPWSNFNNTCLNQSLFLTQPSKVFHKKEWVQSWVSQFSRWFIHSTIKDISGIQGALLGTESRREEGIASSSFSLLGPQSPLGRLSDYLVPFSYGAETPGEVQNRAVTFGGRQEWRLPEGGGLKGYMGF